MKLRPPVKLHYIVVLSPSCRAGTFSYWKKKKDIESAAQSTDFGALATVTSALFNDQTKVPIDKKALQRLFWRFAIKFQASSFRNL